MDDRLPGSDQHLLHERAHERPGLGDFTRPQERAHVLGERGDGIGVVEEITALGQHGPGFLGGELQLLLTLPVFPDALRGVAAVEVRALDEAPDAVQLLPLLGQLQFQALEPLPLLVGHTVHLLVQHPHEVADVGLGEDVVPYLTDDGRLEALRVESRRVAGPLAPLQQGLTDVVGVAAALRLGGGERLAAPLTHGPSRITLRRSMVERGCPRTARATLEEA